MSHRECSVNSNMEAAWERVASTDMKAGIKAYPTYHATLRRHHNLPVQQRRVNLRSPENKRLTNVSGARI